MIQPGHLDDAGKPLVFVDLERIDFFYIETGSGPDFQRIGVTLNWMDEGFTDGRSLNPTRKMSMVRLTLNGDPTDVYDQVVYVDFPIVDFLATSQDSQGRGTLYDNDPNNLGRRWTSDLPDNPYRFVSNSRCSDAIEARLNAGQNVSSAEYAASVSAVATEFLHVDYLTFFVTNIDGQMIGNIMPITDLVKSLDHSGSG